MLKTLLCRLTAKLKAERARSVPLMESLSHLDLPSAEKAYRHLVQRKVGSYHPVENHCLLE